MGSGRWDTTSTAYDHRVRSRATDASLRVHGTRYTADIAAGVAQPRVHQLLNPHGVRYRESRDSAANPNSLPIAVFFDVTGSMGDIPVTLQSKLQRLMRTITERGYVTDPHVFFGAIGDATCDKAPLQVGQFEADIQMDEDLSRIYLEGNGGGQIHESYELAYYFAARHFASDAWDKRQKKGYLFTIGDEKPYDHVKAHEVKAICGEDVQGPLTTEAIIAEAEERWHCFHILADTDTTRRYPDVGNRWRALMGDRVLPLADPEHVAELVATVVGITEQRVTPTEGAQNLRDMGVDDAAIRAIMAAVEPALRAITLVD